MLKVGALTHTLVIHEDNGRATSVRFTGPPPEVKARVSVIGSIAADGVLDLAQAPSVTQPAPTAVAATGSQNAIFILVKFLDSASDPFSQAPSRWSR